MKTIWYSVNNSNTRFSIEISDTRDIYRPIEQEIIVEKCAEDYFWNHDGMDKVWIRPTFHLYESKDGSALNSFYVELEMQPTFYTYKKD